MFDAPRGGGNACCSKETRDLLRRLWCTVKLTLCILALVIAALVVLAVLVLVGNQGATGATGPPGNSTTGATGATGPAGNSTTGTTGAAGAVNDTGLILMESRDAPFNPQQPVHIYSPSGSVLFSSTPSPSPTLAFNNQKMVVPRDCLASDFRAFIAPPLNASATTCGPFPGTRPCNATYTYALSVNSIANPVLNCSIPAGSSQCTDPFDAFCLRAGDFIVITVNVTGNSVQGAQSLGTSFNCGSALGC